MNGTFVVFMMGAFLQPCTTTRDFSFLRNKAPLEVVCARLWKNKNNTKKKGMWHMYVYPLPASGCWQTTVNIWLWQTVHFFLFFEWSRCTYLSLLRYFKDSLSCHSSSSLYTFMPQQVTVASLHTDMFTNSLEHLTVDHHLSFQSFASSPGVAIRCLELINPPLHWLQPTLRLQHFKQTEFKKRKPVKQDWIRETDKVRVAVKVI